MARGASYAVATFLAFPHPSPGACSTSGLPLRVASRRLRSLLALRGLGVAARASAPASSAGWLAHSLVLHWIYVVTVVYGHARPLIGVLAVLVLAAFIALFSGGFGAAAGVVRRARAAGAVRGGRALDRGRPARASSFTGFPWATLGYAQHDELCLRRRWRRSPASTALSFAGALGGAGLAAALEAAPPRAAALALAARGWRCTRSAPRSPRASAAQPAPSVRVAVLQGNIDQGVKWSSRTGASAPSRSTRT